MKYTVINNIKYVNIPEWEQFISRHPKGNIFQTPYIYDVYEKTPKYFPHIFVVYDEQKRIVGSLLAVVIKEYDGFLGYMSSRSIIQGGPVIKNDDSEILEIILKEFSKIIKSKAIYSQYRNFWEFDNNEKNIFKTLGYKYEDHLDIINKLENIEQVWSNLKRSAKKNINKSINNDVKFIEIGKKEELKDIYLLIQKVYKRAKLPIPDIQLFYNVYDILVPHSLAHFFIAKKDKNIIGGRIVFSYKKLIYDWYAGSDEKFQNYRANDFLPWKIMEWGIDNGYKIFDFGGAGKPNVKYGIRDYKLKFGGDLLTFGRFEKIHNPIMMKIGKLGFKIWRLIK